MSKISSGEKVNLRRQGINGSHAAYAADVSNGSCMFVWNGDIPDEIKGTSVYVNDGFSVERRDGQVDVSYRDSLGGTLTFRSDGSPGVYRSYGLDKKSFEAAVDAEKNDFLRYRKIIDGAF